MDRKNYQSTPKPSSSESSARLAWIKTSARYYHKDYPFMNLDQIESILMKADTPSEAKREIELLASKVQSKTLAGFPVSISDDAIMFWLNQFPSIDPEEIKHVLQTTGHTKSATEQKAIFEKMQQQQQQRIFKQAIVEVEKSTANHNRSRNLKSSSNHYDDDGEEEYVTEHFLPVSNPSSPNHPASSSSTSVPRNDEAMHSSFWHNASQKQRERITNHYCHEYKQLTEHQVRLILQSTFDLPAAEEAFGKALKGVVLRECDDEFVDHVYYAQKRLVKKTQQEKEKKANAVRTTTSAVASAATTTSLHSDDHANSISTHIGPIAAEPGSLEYEVVFFSEMFDGKISLPQIVDVLSKNTETGKRMEILHGLVDQAKTNSRIVPSSAATTSSFDAAKLLESNYKKTQEYGQMFPQLTREEILNAIDFSTDPISAMTRLVEKKQQEEEKQRQQVNKNNEKRTPLVPNDVVSSEQKETALNIDKKMESDDDEDEFEEFVVNECVVCMSAPRTHVCIPCGHRVCCEPCVQRVEASGSRNCPVCRKRFVGIFRVYD